MGVAGRLAGHRAQAEALGGVEAGGLEVAVVVGERLGLAVFQEQLAVLGAGKGIVDQALQAALVQVGTVIKKLVGDA